MKSAATILGLMALGACAAPPAPPGYGDRPQEVIPAFDAAAVREDLESSARARFGDAAVETALGSHAHLFAKHYPGLPISPSFLPDGVSPEPPLALLIRREGGWAAARPDGGWTPLRPEDEAALLAAVSDPVFRAEVLPAPFNVEPIRDRLGRAPEYHRVADAGHFDFLPPCSEALKAAIPMLCQSQPGFDRAAFHQAFNREAVRFFHDKL